MSTESIKASALMCAARGWKVFPVTPNDKAGLVGCHAASSDPALIEMWWERYPDANYGIHMGASGLYGVDLDMHGLDGVAAWVDLMSGHGSVGSTFTVRTPTGGRHLYFRALPSQVERLRNTQSVLAPGIDTRWLGGHLVGPGSTIDGIPYEITNTATPAPLAEWLVKLQTKPEVKPPAPVRPAQQSAGDATERVNQLAAELGSAPLGQGNATAARVAYMVGQYVGAGQIGRMVARELLLTSMAAWTWRTAADARTMVGTIDRQLVMGEQNSRAWEDFSSVEIVIEQ